jgi:hypothetical protein
MRLGFYPMRRVFPTHGPFQRLAKDENLADGRSGQGAIEELIARQSVG